MKQCQELASPPPIDATARRAVKPVICYPNKTLPTVPLALYQSVLQSA